MNLLFVCSENRLRSPTAEAVFSDYLVLDRESNRSEKKAGLSQNFSLFEENSSLFDDNNGKFWPNPVFSQQIILSRSGTI